MTDINYTTKELLELPRFTLPEIRNRKLDNGINITELEAESDDLIRFDIVFRSGKLNSGNPALASSCLELMAKGTKSHSTSELAEILDETGAIIDLTVSSLVSSVSVIVLKEELNVILPVIIDMLNNPTFDEKSLELHLNSSLQSYQVQRMRTSVLAREALIEGMFGSSHPLGRFVTEDDIKSINYDALVSYHKNQLLAHAPNIYVSGLSKDDVEYFDGQFSDMQFLSSNSDGKTYKDLSIDKSIRIDKTLEAASQTSLLIGLFVPGRTHKDYAALTLMNTILGGYFSSRLMSNLREDKGYTYGIGSSILTGKIANYMVISADLGNAYLEDSIQEVMNEIEKLKNELVNADELNTARNYLFGSLLRSMDGAFSQQSLVIDMEEQGLELEWLETIRENLMSITEFDIQEMATKYLNAEHMVIATCGPNEQQN